MRHSHAAGSNIGSPMMLSVLLAAFAALDDQAASQEPAPGRTRSPRLVQPIEKAAAAGNREAIRRARERR